MQVFISYAREDYPAAQKLYSRLLAIPGVSPWLDKENLLPGADWEWSILRALENSSFMIVLLSKHSIDKEGFIQKEIREGLRHYERFPPGSIYLIPARLDDCLPAHGDLRKLNWVDLFLDWEKGLKKIIEVIELKKKASETKEQVNINVSPENSEPDLDINSSPTGPKDKGFTFADFLRLFSYIRH